MTIVDEATASVLTTVTAPPQGVARRIIGPIAVGIALLSALITFLVLAGLTPIAPTGLAGFEWVAAFKRGCGGPSFPPGMGQLDPRY